MNAPAKQPAKNETHQLNGGAWKVAAADFFTAMMALFMVMWILSQDDEMLAQTAHFFNNPYIALGDRDRDDVSRAPIDLGGSANVGTGDDEGRGSIDTKSLIEMLAAQFIQHLNIDAADEASPFSINTTDDGMMLTVFNRSQSPLFEEDTAEFTPWGTLVMRNISWLIDRYDVRVRIESHTIPSLNQKEGVDSWDLSAEQANAVRRSMVYYALDPAKISRITAYADSHPLPDHDLDAPDHQRIIISLEP